MTSQIPKNQNYNAFGKVLLLRYNHNLFVFKQNLFNKVKTWQSPSRDAKELSKTQKNLEIIRFFVATTVYFMGGRSYSVQNDPV